MGKDLLTAARPNTIRRRELISGSLDMVIDFFMDEEVLGQLDLYSSFWSVETPVDISAGLLDPSALAVLTEVVRLWEFFISLCCDSNGPSEFDDKVCLTSGSLLTPEDFDTELEWSWSCTCQETRWWRNKE